MAPFVFQGATNKVVPGCGVAEVSAALGETHSCEKANRECDITQISHGFLLLGSFSGLADEPTRPNSFTAPGKPSAFGSAIVHGNVYVARAKNKRDRTLVSVVAWLVL